MSVDLSTKVARTNLPMWLGSGEVILSNLGLVNVVFGPNGSGKSTILRQLCKENPEEYHIVSPERPGEFSYNPSYATQEERGESRISSRGSNLTTDHRERVFSRLSAYLKIRGAITAPSTDTAIEKITEFMSILLPDYYLTYSEEANKDFIIRRAGDQTEATAASMSSGEADLLTVGLDIISMCLLWRVRDIENPILFLDEPNTHLHPDLDERLALGIQSVVREYGVRIFVGSHSTSLLAAIVNACGENVRLYYIKKGECNLKGITPSHNIQQLSAIIGGNTIMGSLFGLPLVLVEGDDDFEVWNQAVRSSKDLRLSILPASGGKPEQDKAKTVLEKLFEAVGVNRTMGYSLKDSDGTAISNQSELNSKIKRLWLGCHEIENLYLSEEVLSSMSLTVEQAKEKLSQKLPQADLDDIFSNRKESSKVKEHMNIITSTLGSHLDRWQSRIGRTIGRERPSGELADFLSPEVVDAFWGGT